MRSLLPNFYAQFALSYTYFLNSFTQSTASDGVMCMFILSRIYINDNIAKNTCY